MYSQAIVGLALTYLLVWKYKVIQGVAYEHGPILRTVAQAG